ncbi:hypothetical protein C9I98_04415 [Photobacterium sanctipauli]|uniref:Lipopolysaccharide biosynthesis protein n=2 Tax=Photobacterium sanctipauli TaxID=1342794 RepID=A0A2T3NY90_9GAMM|nr:oligosaccharide flippase family protein [Photobacterium sanctipauli]PSW21202.1 hypothetical protein C9I98_04415 [Photobacterium sanctipauli]
MKNNDLGTKIIKSTAWNVIIKWSEHIIALLSIIILSRILTPYDFGIVSIATLVTIFFEIFSRLGTEEYLIKKKDLEIKDINSAWTLQILFKIVVSLSIFYSSYIAPDFFNEPKIDLVLKVLAIVPLLSGLTNIDLIIQKRNLEFEYIAKSLSYSKLLSFVVTILVAAIFQSYWAFIIGTITYHAFLLIFSYTFFEYRPKLNIESLYKQWSFTKWTLLKGVVNYINGKIDQILITKFLNTSTLGSYTLSMRLIETPSSALISPLTSAAFPGVASVKSNKDLFLDKINKVLFIIIIFTLPLVTVLTLYSKEIVQILLGSGEKWSLVVDIISLLFPLLVLSTLSGNIVGFITILGKVKNLFLIELIISLVSTILLYYAIVYQDFITFIYTRYIVEVIYLSANIYFLSMLTGLKLLRFLFILFVFSTVNLIVFSFINSLNITFEFDLITMFVNVTLYFSCYLFIVSLIAFIFRNKTSELHFLFTQIKLALKKIQAFMLTKSYSIT